MRKYVAIFKIGLIRVTNYRGPQLIYVLISFSGLLTVIALWNSSASGHSLAGYSKNQLISYSILGLVVSAAVSFNPFGSIKREIKDGSIALSNMAKPVSYYLQRLLLEASWRIHYVMYNLLTFSLACIVFSRNLDFPAQWSNLPFLIVAIINAILINYTLTYCLALIAFWFTEVESLNSIKWLCLSILGGSSLPIAFIPKSAQIIVQLLPFRYMYSIVMEIFFQKLTGTAIVFAVMIQFFWLFVLVLIAKILYMQGLKKYVSVGQ